MKRLLYAAAFLAILAGCAKEPVVEPDNEASAGSDLVTYTFRAGLTKATVSDTGVFGWSSADQIAVYNTKNSTFYTFTSSAGDGVFTGTAPADATFSVAYYPASVATGVNEVTLPSIYTQAEAVAGKSFPMKGTVSGSNIAFEHLGALLKISIDDVPANATKLVLSSDDKLCGAFTPATNAGHEEIQSESGASTVTVTLSNASRQNLAFYFPVPAGTYSYTVTLGDDTTDMLVKSTTSDKTLARASIHRLSGLTVSYPATSEKLIGYFSYGGNDLSWDAGNLVSFTPVDGQYGWQKISNLGMRNNHVSFKLYNGGVYTGIVTDDTSRRQIEKTKLTVAASGEGNDATIYGNDASLDIYYNPVTSVLFSLPAGSAFSIPTASSAHIDKYHMTGAYDGGSWGTCDYLETVAGHDDWRVVQNVGTSENKINFKFWNPVVAEWGDAFGADFSDEKPSNVRCITGGQNIIITDGTTASYDVYVKTDASMVFALPAGSAFALPFVHENSLVYKIRGKVRVGGVDDNWSTSFDLAMVSGEPDWMVCENVDRHSEETNYMGFKVIYGNYSRECGMSSEDPWKDLGTFYDAVTTSAQNCNVYVPSDTNPIDIYVKTDLSKIGVFTHGTSVVFP